jgi:hypothetical protein
MASREDISKMVAFLSAAYPNWNVSEYTLEVYYEDLQDIPAEELRIAAKHCRTEIGRKFAPSVGEIRGAVADIRRSASNVPSTFQAWQEVQKQILENGGDYGNPEWSSPLVEEAVRRMGWRNLRMSEDQTADRARFLQCYEQLVERATKEDMLLPDVRGYIEANAGTLLNAPAEQIRQLTEGLMK